MQGNEIYQNDEKMITVSRLCGHGSMFELARLFKHGFPVPGTLSEAGRYLWLVLSMFGQNGPERQRRIADARTSYYRMGFFWRTKAPFRLKSIIFIATVVDSSSTGIESFAWTDTDADALKHLKFLVDTSKTHQATIFKPKPKKPVTLCLFSEKKTTNLVSIFV